MCILYACAFCSAHLMQGWQRYACDLPIGCNTGASLQLRSAVTSAGRAWALVGMTSMSLPVPKVLYLMNFPICIEPTIGSPGLSGLACFIASLACRCCHQGSTSPIVGYLSPCSTSVAFNTFNSVQLRQHGGLVPPRTVPVPAKY